MKRSEALLTLELKNIPLYKKGKVREVYDLGERLLFAATDRISAFDVIMPNGIPQKGEVLNMLSAFWFNFLADVLDNHMITVDIEKIISAEPKLAPYRDALSARSMLVKKTEPIPIECVVRGYLSGSGWKDYQKNVAVSGIKLPEGLEESGKLPEVIFTPSTKADTGHDMNITEREAADAVGREVFKFLKEKSIALYKKASHYAESKGIIIADTKFEFGMINDKIILIDEALTPDSSRFWPMDEYHSGRGQRSFDKQFVRDYLQTLDWPKRPPAPELPPDIVEKTRRKYLEAYRILAGKDL